MTWPDSSKGGSKQQEIDQFVVDTGSAYSGYPSDRQRRGKLVVGGAAMEAILERVSEKYNRLAIARPLPEESLQSLRDDFLVRYSHETTALEGNTLSLEETRTILQDRMTVGGKLLREYFEVVNVHRALVWLEDFIASGKPISEETILELHAIVMDHILDRDAGAYRRQPVRIVGSPHIPPNWMTVPTVMKGLIERLAQGPGNEDPITFAARAHIELASIHPFIDGNGRVSRLLVNLVLMRSGYLPAMYRVKERTRYISALQRADTEGDDTDFVAVTAKAVEVMLDQRIEFASRSTS